MMLFSEFNSVSNSISNFVRIGENEFDRCSVNFTNRFPIFSATEEYGLDCHAVSRLAALRRVYGLQRLCPRVLSNQRHSHLSIEAMTERLASASAFSMKFKELMAN